ncbi:hypothetical protein FS837_003430, partial [Tulasnella sp. UAMH 9824]
CFLLLGRYLHTRMTTTASEGHFVKKDSSSRVKHSAPPCGPEGLKGTPGQFSDDRRGPHRQAGA